ncbi:MAG: CDP-diacylglycerol--glycerol-3-phosphate 3-phosphatidyltransferase [Clostridia bacterium]|nr:CDP-diacylglycerol--glycerol-3-phosphate 3-phosphatidyltransferase [Clostridia bacterium]
MNLPNKLSLLRVLLIPFMILFMYIPGWGQLAALIVFAVASFTDFLDGHIARSQNIVTNFGKFIDPVADKLLVLSALVMLVAQGRMPAWALVVILARELSVDGLRLIAVEQGKVIAAGPLGKIKTVSQIVCILWLMLSGFVQLPEIISTVLILWVVFITLWSGIFYFLRSKQYLKGA